MLMWVLSSRGSTCDGTRNMLLSVEGMRIHAHVGRKRTGDGGAASGDWASFAFLLSFSRCKFHVLER
eukprot:6483381-Amphidinium_carterae.1